MRRHQAEEMSQSEVIEAQLQQAQQERTQIFSELEQLKQLQVQLKSQLDQVLSLVKPLEGLQLFDPGVLQSQLLEIQEQLRQAQKERTQLSDFQSQIQSNLQSQLSKILSQLEKSNKERAQETAVELSSLREQLSNLQTQLQQGQQEQKQMQSLLSELPSQVSQLVKAELEKVQPQTTMSPRVVPPSMPNFDPLNDPWSPTNPAPPSSFPATIKTPDLAQDELISVRGVDYTRLRDLLAVGKWQQADRETKFVMLKVAGIGQEGKLDKELLKNFSCEDLRTIDQLWVKYSNGHFGFTVQKCIFERVGGKPSVDDYKAYCGFGEQVGWLVKNCWLSESDLEFTLNASCGHLPLAPFLTLIRGIRSRKLYFCDFFSRVETCKM